MKNENQWAVIATALLLLTGCASTSKFPQAVNVVISDDAEGSVGLSCHREKAVFENTDLKKAVQAAQTGLKKEGFVPTHVSEAEGILFGEHGMTLRNWNIIAGVYIREVGRDVIVVVVVRGSKKPGFVDDVKDGAWTGKILKSMRESLAP